MESAYALAENGPGTGNVAFFPKVNVLVINAAVLAGLTDEQRQLLEQAAAETRTWSVETRLSDAEAATTFCEDGGTIALASQADLAALEAATLRSMTIWRRTRRRRLEGWFKRLTERRLRRGVFTSVDDLIQAIEIWADHWNHDPSPLIWHKPAEEIIAKIQRGRTALTHQTKSATHH